MPKEQRAADDGPLIICVCGLQVSFHYTRTGRMMTCDQTAETNPDALKDSTTLGQRLWQSIKKTREEKRK